MPETEHSRTASAKNTQTSDSLLEKNPNLYILIQDILQVYDHYLSPFNIPKEELYFARVNQSNLRSV